jgi:hypothetical protein
VKTFPLEPVEKSSTQELKRLQLERLRSSLAHGLATIARRRKIRIELSRALPENRGDG